MTHKIFRLNFISTIIVLLLSSTLMYGVLYQYFTKISQKQLKEQLHVVADGVNTTGEAYLEHLQLDNYRITWIDRSGTVLFDNSTEKKGALENHLDRSEVKEAFQSGMGESKRYSSTMLKRSLYEAVKLKDGTVLRLSIAQNTVLSLVLGMLQPILLIIIIAVCISLAIAKIIAKRIVKPLNLIDLDHPLENEEYDELSPLLRRINVQQVAIKKKNTELSQKQEEMNTILGSLEEGMILLNKKGKIITINTAVAHLMELNLKECIGMDILSLNRDIMFQSIIENALAGNRNQSVVEIFDGYYQVSATPISNREGLQGVAIVLFDVTQKEQSEQLRREFSANVSHELKTPLHAISGYAELMKNGMVKSSDVIPFSEKIYKETQHMIGLIEDIISLSHLDEDTDDFTWEEVDLYQIAKETAEQFKGKANQRQVDLYVDGESVKIQAVVPLVREIIYNLCDNAVKYNQIKGSVTIDVHREEQQAVLSVTDTGIGISKEDQKRIFERFYRGDKSHSKEINGTGLGLSIVKHAANIHKAAVEVSSEVHKGSCIRILFPIE